MLTILFPGAGVEKHGEYGELVGRRTPRWDSGTGTENVATLPVTISFEIWVITKNKVSAGYPGLLQRWYCSVSRSIQEGEKETRGVHGDIRSKRFAICPCSFRARRLSIRAHESLQHSTPPQCANWKLRNVSSRTHQRRMCIGWRK